MSNFSVIGKNRLGESEIHGAGHWIIDDIYVKKTGVVHGKNIHIIGHGSNQPKTDQYDVILYLKDTIYYEDVEDKFPDIDPYGEEDWEFESKVYENNNSDPLNIKDKIITFDTMREVHDIFHTLTSYGYKFYNYDSLFSEILDNHYDCFLPFSPGQDWDYRLARKQYFSMETIGYPIISHLEDILKLTTKKITREDIDPYGEGRIRWYRNGKLDESLNDEFEVGDRVVYVYNNEVFSADGKTSTLDGLTGKIVFYIGSQSYAIEFDEKIPNGHGCGGKAIYGHGYNVDKIFLKKLDGTPGTPEKTRIRWYRNGKLDESKLNSFKDFHL